MSAPLGSDTRAVAGLGNELAKLQHQVEMLQKGMVGNDLGFSSIEDGSLIIYDANGDPRTVIGKQDDGSYVGGAPVGFSTPPEPPADPTVIPGFGTVRVMSHGSADPPWPKDFSHVTVYLAKGVEGGPIPLEPGTPAGTIIGTEDSMLVISGLDPGVDYRCWLTSTNISGAESTPSNDVIFTPLFVVGPDILDGAINDLKLAADAVTSAKIAAGAVGEVQLGEKVVNVQHLADGSVEGDKIAAATIAAGNIASDAIRTNHIAAGQIQAFNIAVGAVQTENIATAAITADKLLALSVTADKLAANSVTAGKIAAGAITADSIRGGTVIADVTLETGVAGRRVQISGPANEIRFYPRLKELDYARLFTYISTAYPDDITLELRAIRSDQTTIVPRLFLTPERLFMGITSAGNDTQLDGGVIDLQQSGSFFGYKTESAGTAGLEVASDGALKLRGHFKSYVQPNPDDAVIAFGTSVTYTTSTGGSTLGSVRLTWGDPMLTPMCTMVTAGTLAGRPYRDYNLVNSPSGEVIDGVVKYTGVIIQINPAVKAAEAVVIFGWFFRVQGILAQNV